MNENDIYAAQNMYDAWDNGDRPAIRRKFARRDELIRLAGEAGFMQHLGVIAIPNIQNLERFADLVAAAERREWQGLTETEQVQVAIDCGCFDVAWLAFARAIEAKLKEKNA